MTIANDTAASGPFFANGVTTAFPFEVDADSADDLKVVWIGADGSETEISSATYTVTFSEVEAGGTVTFSVAPTVPNEGDELWILLDPVFEQQDRYSDEGPFNQSLLEGSLDSNARLSIWLKGQVERSIRYPIGEAAGQLTGPDDRANTIIGFDEAGAFKQFELESLATNVAFATARSDVFAGDGVETAFTLTLAPRTVNNCAVFIDGVRQTPGVDYTVLGATLTFTTAPYDGAGILATYAEALTLQEASGEDVSFYQAGAGAVFRTAQDKLRETVTPADFGAVGVEIGGSAIDETAALTAFFNSAIANPGVPHVMPQRVYGISSPLPTINQSGVIIRGCGQSFVHNVGPIFTNTTIVWLGGVAAGPALTVQPDVDAVAGQVLSNIELTGLSFFCGGTLATGVAIRSVRSSTIGLGVSNATATGVILGVLGSGDLFENESLQTNDIYLSLRQVDGAGIDGVPLRLQGSATANVSLNRFRMVDIVHGNASAVIEENADNNIWEEFRSFAAGTATYSVEWLGGASESVSCRAEVFYKFTANKAPVGRGTGTYTYPATNNVIFSLDTDNASPAPVYETGATGVWSDSRGFHGGSSGGVLGVGAAFGDGISSLIAARERLGVASLHLTNGSEAHLVLSDNANTHRWRLFIGASGDLILGNLAGGGTVNLGGLVTFSGKVVEIGAADSGGTGFRVLRIAN